MFEADIIGQGDVFVNGTLTSSSTFNNNNNLSVRILTGDLHISIDGVIGQKIHDETTPSTNQTNILLIDISRGNLTNFGILSAQDFLELKAKNLMLCSDSKHDTAHRGFDSFVEMKKDQGFINDTASNPKTTSSFSDDRLLRAVTNIDCETFVSAVKEEIDPSVRVHGKNIHDELSRRKHNVLDQERREIIRGGLIMCQWRHGAIKAPTIRCTISEDIQDCSQLQANIVHLNVAGSVKVVKPWTLISNIIDGQIQGDLIFDDNAMLGTLDNLQVLGNVLISKTSIIWVRDGGRLYCEKMLFNGNQIVCEADLVLDLGVLKQESEAMIISKGDLLIALRDEQENAWFGSVLVHRHLFMQLEKRVVVDADLVASECHIEFFGCAPQLIVKKTLAVEAGDLNLKAEDVNVVPNFVLVGELYARGVEGTTASFKTMSGAVANLLGPHKVNMRTRCMEISIDSTISCDDSSRESKSGVDTDPLPSVTIYCKEEILINGELHVLGHSSTIQAQNLSNAGEITSTSCLSIECEKVASNTGNVICNGNMTVKSEALSNAGEITSTSCLSIECEKVASNTGNVICNGNMTVKSEALSNAGEITSTSCLSIECEKIATNAGNIKCDGNITIKSEDLSNENGVIMASPNIHIEMSSCKDTVLSGQLYMNGCLYLQTSSQNKLYFTAFGGKNKGNGIFFLPDIFQIFCTKGLSI